jgi:hypothetical protein
MLLQISQIIHFIASEVVEMDSQTTERGVLLCLISCFGLQAVFLGRADWSVSLCPIFISQHSYGIRSRRKLVGLNHGRRRCRCIVNNLVVFQRIFRCRYPSVPHNSIGALAL